MNGQFSEDNCYDIYEKLHKLN
jgi:hypothetical protein